MKHRSLLILGAFAEQLRKCYPSVRIELGFSRYFTFEIFNKICRPHSSLLQIGGSRHFTCRRMHVYGNISLHMIKLVLRDISIIPIILGFHGFFSFCHVGSTHQIITWFVWRVEYLFFRLRRSLSPTTAIFFLWKGEYFCLSICFVIKLSNFYLLTEVINVGLGSELFLPAFSNFTPWLVCMTFTAISRHSMVLTGCVFFVCLNCICSSWCVE